MDTYELGKYLADQLKPAYDVIADLQKEGGQIDQIGAQLKSAADTVVNIKIDAPKLDMNSIQYYIKR